MTLKRIKVIMTDPCLDRNQLLYAQKNILVQKKERLERIIASMDQILEGENKMDFEVFSKQLYQMKNMSAFMLEMAKEYCNNKKMQAELDIRYGVGASVYIAEALEEFYK